MGIETAAAGDQRTEQHSRWDVPCSLHTDVFIRVLGTAHYNHVRMFDRASLFIAQEKLKLTGKLEVLFTRTATEELLKPTLKTTLCFPQREQPDPIGTTWVFTHFPWPADRKELSAQGCFPGHLSVH